MRVEVSFVHGKQEAMWSTATNFERILLSDEVLQLFVWGNKQGEAAEARYKWLSDLVKLKLTESETSVEKERRNAEPRSLQKSPIVSIMFEGFDNANPLERRSRNVNFVRKHFSSLFGRTRDEVNFECAFK